MDNMKLVVIPEGRKNVWIPQVPSLKEFIKSRGFKSIHNFKGGSNLIIGADHDVESVLGDIDKAERSAIFTDKHQNMGHSLALIINNQLECYDIGEIKAEDIIDQAIGESDGKQ